jgi:zinc transporter 1/2/3
MSELNSLVEYPVGGVTVLGGLLLLMMVDNILVAYLVPRSKQHQHDDADGHIHGSTKAAVASGVEDKDAGSPLHGLEVVHGQDTKVSTAAQHIHSSKGADKDVESGGRGGGGGAVSSQQRHSVGTHSHQCLSSFSAHQMNMASTSSCDGTGEQYAGKGGGAGSMDMSLYVTLRQMVTAYSMELGCIFHSFIIGLSAGVITDDRNLVITYLVALTFHQSLEALALGSVLVLVQGFSTVKRLVMILTYSLMTPLGVAVGILISESYDGESRTAVAVQGSLNAVSGGMLLYIAMYNLLGEEFSRTDVAHRRGLQWGLFGAVLLGVTCMAVLAIWG